MSEDRLDQRLQIVASQKFIDMVDEWRRRQAKIPSRSEAIRVLAETGMEALGIKPKTAKR
jgi:hypothetical protein